MDDPNTRTRKLVTTLINTVNQSSGADIDVVLELLKEYKVRVTGSRWLLCMLTTCDPTRSTRKPHKSPGDPLVVLAKQDAPQCRARAGERELAAGHHAIARTTTLYGAHVHNAVVVHSLGFQKSSRSCPRSVPRHWA